LKLPEDRAPYKLTFKDGKIYGADGSPFDTSSATTVRTVGKVAIFVMDEQGNFYASNTAAEGKFHHSSFFAGKPVAAAGELRVDNGVLKVITDESGHYHPTIEFSDQAVKILEAYGIDMTQVDIKFRPPKAAPAP
jgi:hypothetical protein